jgi:transposase
MALGRQRERQTDMLVSWAEMPRSPGHAFYDKLQAVLIAAGFDRFVETRCAVNYAPRIGRPSLPPGRYFRMLLIGYFEGIDSERGLEWRCADSLSLRDFLRLGERERVPDHSWLSRTRSRLSLEVHDQVFSWVLERLAEHGLIKGERIGVDASTIEANAALRTIIRRDSGEGYREMLTAWLRRAASRRRRRRTWSGWIASAKARSCPMRTGRARPIRMPGSPS